MKTYPTQRVLRWLCCLLMAPVLHAQAQIVIGQVLPLTGPQAAFGQAVKSGTEALVHSVNNQGGVNGNKLVLAVKDDAFNPEKTAALVTDLVKSDNAIGIVSLIGGANVLAALPAGHAAGVPIVGVLNGNPGLRAQPNSTITHVRSSLDSEMNEVIKQYTVLGMSRFAFFSPDDKAGQAAANGMKNALAAQKLDLVAAIGYDRKATDFKPYADQVAKAKADVLIVFAPARAAADLIFALKAASVRTRVVCASMVDEQTLFGMLKEKSKGVVFASVVPSPFGVNLAINREYQAALKASGVTDVSLASFEAFINAKVLVEAIRRAGDQPTRASVLKTLATMAPLDLGGITFHAQPQGIYKAGINISDIVMLSDNGRLVR